MILLTDLTVLLGPATGSFCLWEDLGFGTYFGHSLFEVFDVSVEAGEH
jgi:hypothetical protein